MAKPGKFVLMIGDEGGILTQFLGGKVVKRVYAPTPNYADTRAMVEMLESDKKAPIYLLIDLMDQSYVQQSLPPVSSLSINKLIKRKMDRDFAADDLKGALPIGREKEGRRDWKYLFVTISHSPQLDSWIDLVIELPNQFKGVYPLPVEAEHFVHRLREAVTGRKFDGKKKKTKGEVLIDDSPKWQLLVAHNKVGGFRQVVLKEGKLVFARLAQPLGDTQPAVVAGSIEQEISVTVEYLKRLGYNDDQGMEAYIITSEAIKNAISPSNVSLKGLHVFSPNQAALKMGMMDVTEPTDQFADGIMSAVFISAKKHALQLDTKQSASINKLYGAILGVQVGAGVATVAAIGALGFYGISIPLTSGKIDDEKTKANSVRIQLEELQEKEKVLPDDLETITDLVAMSKRLNNLGASPMDALERYRNSQRPGRTLLSNFTWETKSPLLVSGGTVSQDPNAYVPADPNASKEAVSISLNVEMFETRRGTEGFNTYLDEYLATLGQSFPGYATAVITPRPGITEEQKKTITLTGDDKDPLLEQPSITMNITLTGTEPPPPPKNEGAPQP